MKVSPLLPPIRLALLKPLIETDVLPLVTWLFDNAMLASCATLRVAVSWDWTGTKLTLSACVSPCRLAKSKVRELAPALA